MDIEERARGLCLMLGTDFFYKEDGERIIAFDFFKTALQAVRDEAIEEAAGERCCVHARGTYVTEGCMKNNFIHEILLALKKAVNHE